MTTVPNNQQAQPQTKAVAQVAAPEKQSPVLALAQRLHFGSAAQLASVLVGTIFPSGRATPEQVAMLCSVAYEHGLNPLKREIYAFPDKGGGIRAIVSIDGWLTIALKNPMFKSMSHTEVHDAGGRLVSTTCTIWRRDLDQPVVATEYLEECYRDTEPWKKQPHRMLKHRATIQAIRYAFGLAGVMDQEDYERMVEYETVSTEALRDGAGRPRTAEGMTAALRERNATAARQTQPVPMARDGGTALDYSQPDPEPTPAELLGVDEPAPADAAPADAPPAEESAMQTVFARGLDVTIAGPFESWADEAIAPTAQRPGTKNPLANHTWRSCLSVRSKEIRDRLLLHVNGALDIVTNGGAPESVPVFSMRCAVVLEMIEAEDPSPGQASFAS